MLSAGSRLGPYEVVAAIGAGGMGEVYRARDTRLGRDVAIKVLPARFTDDPDRLRRFEREARAVAALDHPNILAIHDVGTEDGSPYFVTELLEGESLRACLNRGKLTPHRAVELAVQIAHGLAAAHEKGIIHRDLKPENVFLARNGVVKILDFGLVKLARPEVDPQAPTVGPLEVTEAGAVAGTQGYMSPEQARGLTLDQRTDVFSFGCVLYEMLSGRRAFLRETAADTISAVLHDEPATLPAVVPGPLGRIVDRCLEKRREDRFSSAHDLALALEVSERDGSAAFAWRRSPGRSWRRRILAGAGVVGVLVAAVWFAARDHTSPLPAFHPRKVAGQFGAVAGAALSPDGKEIAYATSEAGTSDIWVVDVRGGRPIRLTDGTASVFGPAWLPDGGSVLYCSSRGTETSIWKVPRFGGSPSLVVPDAQDGSVSPDGNRIAFARREKDGDLRVWIAPLAVPDDAIQVTRGGEGLWDHREPVWSPDGETLCYRGQRDLWLVSARGGPARRFTQDDFGDSHPVWSRDGRYIYFASEREGTRSLWRKAVAGGPPARVTHGAGLEDSPTTSRDGRHLAFLSGLETAWVAVANLQTGEVQRLEEGQSTSMAAIAPDRRSLVFTSNLAGSWDLWSLALGGGAAAAEPRRITEPPGTCAAPAFSPDGRWIAYHRAIGGQRDVWVVPASGGAPVNFTGREGANVQPAWSPDGRQLAFSSNRDGAYRIWSAPISEGRRTGPAREVSRDPGDASAPAWSPDGKTIAYVRRIGSGDDVELAPSDGRDVGRLLTSNAGAFKVRWHSQRRAWAVSGFWREHLPSLRLVAPGGGPATRVPLPTGVALDLEYPDFDISSDGTILAVYQRTRREEIWILDVEAGSF